jgi:ADP-heptose:LPS heptosyltransferase
MNLPKPILVIRLSALGDVALMIPVFKSLETAYPHQKFYFLTRHSYQDLFWDCKNVTVIPCNFYQEHKGITGLTKLSMQLNQYDYDTLIDLHNVLRTKALRGLIKLKNKQIIVFNKGKKEKKQLVKSKLIQTLPHTTQRYLDAFSTLGLKTTLDSGPWLKVPETGNHNHKLSDILPKTHTWIGIAPFSKHESKEWPIKNIQELLLRIQKDENNRLFLLAFGEDEKIKAKEIIQTFPQLIVVDESFSLPQQLSLLKQLDVLVSMDSGNMHLASILGTKVVSIWGATHPAVGFSPLNNEAFIVQPTPIQAPWRPLSIYGKLSKSELPLAKKTMQLITVETVYNTLQQAIQQ